MAIVLTKPPVKILVGDGWIGGYRKRLYNAKRAARFVILCIINLVNARESLTFLCSNCEENKIHIAATEKNAF